MYDAKSKERTMKYRKENREEVRFDVPKGMKDIYKEFAKKRGMSLAALIMYLVESEMEKDGFYYVEEERAKNNAAKQTEMQSVVDRLKAENVKSIQNR
jgi:hypothetical protein